MVAIAPVECRPRRLRTKQKTRAARAIPTTATTPIVIPAIAPRDRLFDSWVEEGDLRVANRASSFVLLKPFLGSVIFAPPVSLYRY